MWIPVTVVYFCIIVKIEKIICIIVVCHAGECNAINTHEAFDDLSEHDVLVVQPSGLCQQDIEL